MLKKNNGLTLAELLITALMISIIILSGYVFLVKTVCQGNFWYTETGVLKELQIDHPNITAVLKTTRYVFHKSVITVKEDGKKRNYYLDTSILWNYEFSECQN